MLRTSGKFTPHAWTSITTCPGAGTGSSTSSRTRDSGGPNCLHCTALMEGDVRSRVIGVLAVDVEPHRRHDVSISRRNRSPPAAQDRPAVEVRGVEGSNRGEQVRVLRSAALGLLS